MYTSNEFWLFVIVVLFLHSITWGRTQNAILLIASYGLYAYLDRWFVVLLVVATSITYLVGRHMTPYNPRRRTYFGIGLATNFVTLAFFKYAGFFASSFAVLLGKNPEAINPIFLNILLPLGISFYTFRMLSYLFDVQNNRLKPELSWLNFAVYVGFFAQIASGPIERAPRFLPALRQTRRLTQEQFVMGLTYIFVGLFYKIAIANPLVQTTESAFNAINTLTPAQAFSTLILYSVQLYADFAGYSALALGVSNWFGLPATDNFRQPYFSQSVIEFWTRWHISLSTWFRDYLFYPLSRFLLKRWGSQRAFRVQVVCYMTTMLATGIWHGATVLFVIWGALHGIYMITEQYLTRFKAVSDEVHPLQDHFNVLANVLITYTAVAISWIFFRAPTLNVALLFFQKLFGPISVPNPAWWGGLLTPIGLVLIIDLMQNQMQNLAVFWTLRIGWRVAVITTLLILLIVFEGHALAPFVYLGF